MFLNRKISTLFGCLLLLAATKSYSQQEAQYTQYMWNPMLLNPAAAGSTNMLRAAVVYRKQWVDIAGAPGTIAFVADAPALSEKTALGIIIAKDKIGIHDDVSIRANYAYRLPLKNGTLGMGLQAGVKNHQAKYSQLDIKNESDANFRSGDVSYFMPEFGFGLYYSNAKSYMGFSVPKIIDNALGKSLFNTNSLEKRHYYLTAGHTFVLNTQFDILPSVLVKATEGAPLQAELSTLVSYQKKISAGISYRTGASVNFLVQAKFYQNFSFGYSYDWATSILRSYNYGSHEIMVIYTASLGERLKLKKNRNVTNTEVK